MRLSRKQLSLLAVIALTAGFMGFFGMRATLGQTATATKSCDLAKCVQLTESGAIPDILTIEVGTVVIFNSADGKKHSLSLGEGGEDHVHSGPFSSGDFEADEAWKVEFKEQGTFEFHDHYNPKLSVLVVVFKPGADRTIKS